MPACVLETIRNGSVIVLDTFRADHCPGFPPLSLLWTSFLISSLSSGSVYFSLGGIETAEGFKLVV